MLNDKIACKEFKEKKIFIDCAFTMELPSGKLVFSNYIVWHQRTILCYNTDQTCQVFDKARLKPVSSATGTS